MADESEKEKINNNEAGLIAEEINDYMNEHAVRVFSLPNSV